MKSLLLGIFVCIVSFVQAQTSTATREIKDSTGTVYIIEYMYNPSWCFVPAVMGTENKSHYNATIIVYRKQNIKGQKGYTRIQVGKQMKGQYVPNGCFEDVPDSWIRTALKQ